MPTAQDSRSLLSEIIDRDLFEKILQQEDGFMAAEDDVFNWLLSQDRLIFERIRVEGIALSDWGEEAITIRAYDILNKECGGDKKYDFHEKGVPANVELIERLRGGNRPKPFNTEAFKKFVEYARPFEQLTVILLDILEEKYKAYKVWLNARQGEDPRKAVYGLVEQAIEQRRKIFTDWGVDINNVKKNVEASVGRYLEWCFLQESTEPFKKY